MTDHSCESLANAVILQAVKDYREANKKLAGGRRNQDAEMMKRDCLRFFRSGWFGMMTEVNSEFLIKKLDEEAGA